MNIKKGEKLAYGIGYLGAGFSFCLYGAYFNLYLTDVLYINPSVAAVAFLIPNLLDVVTDVIFMNWIDKTKTKYGVYRPWLLSGIALSIFMYLQYIVPDFIKSENGVFIWALGICFISVPILETIYFCPYYALGTVMSKDMDDRSSLIVYRNVFYQVANLLVVGTAFPLLLHFGDESLGYKDPLAWSKMTLIYGIIGIIGCIICFKFVRERVDFTKDQKKEKVKFIEKIKLLSYCTACKKNIAILSIASFCVYFFSTLISYYCIYNLGNEDLLTTALVISICFYMLFAIAASYLEKKIGCKKLIYISALSFIVAGIFFIFTKGFLGLIVFTIIKNFGVCGIYIAAGIYVPLCIDDIYKKTGENPMGVVQSMHTSIEKIFVALGIFLFDIVLGIGKYDSLKLVQEAYTLNWIKYSPSVLYIICGTLILFINNKLTEFDDINEAKK